MRPRFSNARRMWMRRRQSTRQRSVYGSHAPLHCNGKSSAARSHLLLVCDVFLQPGSPPSAPRVTISTVVPSVALFKHRLGELDALRSDPAATWVHFDAWVAKVRSMEKVQPKTNTRRSAGVRGWEGGARLPAHSHAATRLISLVAVAGVRLGDRKASC